MALDKKDLDRSIHLLEGLLKGIAFDQKINTKEIDELNHWIAEHEDDRRHYPYTVLIPLLASVLADLIITEDEKKDILWFCNKVSTENLFYDIVFSDLQRLKGIIHGIISDKIIRDEEVFALETWLNDNFHLKGHYPYDELVTIIHRILKDRFISDKEKTLLERYFIEFISETTLSSYSPKEIQEIKTRISLNAVCAIDPKLTVEGKYFAITGQINRSDKSQLMESIKELGGKYSQHVTEQLDYLIVCDESALMWGFEPYGRKIDQALSLRSKGHPIVILQKKDFKDFLKTIE